MANTNPLIDSLPRKKDPQIIVTGTVKQGEKSEMIVFSIPLALFEIVCIVTIPNEDEAKLVPVYVKFRVNSR